MKILNLVHFLALSFLNHVSLQSLIDNNLKYKCGIRTIESQDKFSTNQGTWPWAVGVIDQNGNTVTSGTLIGAFYVLTSKKAISDAKEIYIIPGQVNLLTIFMIYKVNRTIMHPDIDNDLAILELDQPLQFSDYIIPICLPNYDYTIIFGKNLTLSGWADMFNFQKDNSLVATKVKVLSQEICGSDPNLYCTVDVTQNLCFNDFGSGLYYFENNVWYLYGVSTNHSYSIYCSDASIQKIYLTIVPKYVDWIKGNLNRTEPDPVVFLTNEPDEYCGKPKIKPNTKIVNGVPSVPNSWPWTVALWGQKVGQMKFLCGGSIISSRFIITAAHCIDYRNSRYFISVGTRRLSNIENFENFHLVKRVITHGFEFNTIRNDIAILELAKPLKFNKKVSKICLPLSSDETQVFNKTLYVTGWGATNIQQISDQQLQAKLKVINFNNSTLCRSRDWFEYCTLGVTNDSNICSGDSGSGLMYFKNDRWHIYGLVSHAINYFGICHNTKPSHHTMLPRYLDWIQRVMKANFNDDQYFVDFE